MSAEPPLPESRDLQAIEADISQTRQYMDETIDELAERLNPKLLMADFRRSSKDRLTAIAQEHPVPVAFLAGSLLWMAARMVKRHGPFALASTSLLWLGAETYSRTPAGRNQVEQLKKKAEQLAEQIAATARKEGDSVAKKASEIREQSTQKVEAAVQHLVHRFTDGSHIVREKITAAGHQVQEATSSAATQIKDRARNQVETATHQHPLASGLGLLALGTVIAIALPHSTSENRFLGSAATRVKQRVSGKGKGLIDQGEEKLEEMAATVERGIEKALDQLPERKTTPSKEDEPAKEDVSSGMPS